jgi:serine/alanine adding enzyme
MKFYNKITIKNIDITYPDIYFTPEYGLACEYSDNAIWELCQYKDLIYVYLKKEYIFENTTYYDLITPYGYSGYYFEKQSTYDEFIPMFRSQSKIRNYITEVVRQNPYLNIDISNYYEVITSRKTFGIDLNNYTLFEDYLKKTHKDNRRGYNLALKKKLLFKMEDYNDDNLLRFLEIYNLTMINLNSKDYYYFNKEYYNSFFKFKENLLFANIYYNDKLIASCIIFKYQKLLHYHIGGSYLEYRNLRPNNLIHCSIIKYGIENDYELYHLGGGLNDNDSLYDFKNKIGDKKFEYTIYKNVLNKEIYDKIKQQYETDDYFPIHRK